MVKQFVIDSLCKCLEATNKRHETLAKRVTGCEQNTWGTKLNHHSHIVCSSRFGHRLSIIAVFPEGYTFRCMDCGLQYAAYEKKGFTTYEEKIIGNLEIDESQGKDDRRKDKSNVE